MMIKTWRVIYRICGTKKWLELEDGLMEREADSLIEIGLSKPNPHEYDKQWALDVAVKRLPKQGDLYASKKGMLIDVIGVVNKGNGIACGEQGNADYVSIDEIEPYNLALSGRTIWVHKKDLQWH